MYFVYLLSCADGSIYTGITTNLERRFAEHEAGKRGAKFTRARKPVRYLHFEEYENRSLASKREAEIKALSRAGKLKVAESREY